MRKIAELPEGENQPETITENESQRPAPEVEGRSLEERVDVAIEQQEAESKTYEVKASPKILTGLRKWAAGLLIMAPSFLAVGCNAEKSSVEGPEPQGVESTQNGFTDNAHDNAKKRLQIKRAEVKRMHENSRRTK